MIQALRELELQELGTLLELALQLALALELELVLLLVLLKVLLHRCALPRCSLHQPLLMLVLVLMDLDLLLVLVLLAMRGSCEVPGGESGSGERRGGRGSGGRDGGRGCGDGRNILKLRRSARRRLIAIAQ